MSAIETSSRLLSHTTRRWESSLMSGFATNLRKQRRLINVETGHLRNHETGVYPMSGVKIKLYKHVTCPTCRAVQTVIPATQDVLGRNDRLHWECLSKVGWYNTECGQLLSADIRDTDLGETIMRAHGTPETQVWIPRRGA